jgi:hypothetical protein
VSRSPSGVEIVIVEQGVHDERPDTIRGLGVLVAAGTRHDDDER